MTSDSVTNESVDVAIVGAGAAGSLVAAKLAEAGKSVVILERGSKRTFADLVSSQIWARRLKWTGDPVFNSGTYPIAAAFNSGFGTGGSAIHHYACWFRLHPEDFKARTLYGKDRDWPLEYTDLQSYYDRIQREVGISGDAVAEVWRPAGDPYPMPALPNFRQGALIAAGFGKLGIHTAPMPHAINSVPYQGRPACINDGWCDAGCPTGALANPLATYLPRAARAGARVISGSSVSRVLVDQRGTRATGVEYFDDRGRRHVQPATLVVLAAFAIQNSRILLNSSTAAFPAGVANTSDAVGRFMMVNISGSVFGMFNDETEPYRGVTGGSLMSQDSYGKVSNRDFYGSYQWLIAQALKPNDLLGIAMSRPELFGNALEKFMIDAAHRIGTMTLVGEDHPQPQNRLTLSKQRDRSGVPLAQTEHIFDADSLALYAHAMREGVQIFQAAGTTEAWHGPIVQQHIFGGTVMGSDPSNSVADEYGRTHDVPNLFICGTSLFPTSGAVNPTFTLHALSLRTSDYILANWSSLS